MNRFSEAVELRLIRCLPKPGNGGWRDWPRVALSWTILTLLFLVMGRGTDETLQRRMDDYKHQMDDHQRHMESMSTEVRMKAIGITFQMYAIEAEGGCWPELAPGSATWVPDLTKLHPEFPMDANFLVSPSHPERERLVTEIRECFNLQNPNPARAVPLVAESFAYLAYEVQDEAEFDALCRARESGHLNGGADSADGAGQSSLRPLRGFSGGEDTPDPDSGAATAERRSKTPVLIEIARWKHRSALGGFDGCDVLYEDGHVGQVPLGSFPVLPRVMDVLSRSES